MPRLASQLACFIGLCAPVRCAISSVFRNEFVLTGVEKQVDTVPEILNPEDEFSKPFRSRRQAIHVIFIDRKPSRKPCRKPFGKALAKTFAAA